MRENCIMFFREIYNWRKFVSKKFNFFWRGLAKEIYFVYLMWTKRIRRGLLQRLLWFWLACSLRKCFWRRIPIVRRLLFSFYPAPSHDQLHCILRFPLNCSFSFRLTRGGPKSVIFGERDFRGTLFVIFEEHFLWFSRKNFWVFRGTIRDFRGTRKIILLVLIRQNLSKTL